MRYRVLAAELALNPAAATCAINGDDIGRAPH
jgi:hypothetical protein